MTLRETVGEISSVPPITFASPKYLYISSPSPQSLLRRELGKTALEGTKASPLETRLGLRLGCSPVRTQAA